MKLLLKILIGIGVILLALGIYVVVAFRTSAPRDLGIKYTDADLTSGHTKSQIIYTTISENVPLSEYWQTSGNHDIDTTFTSSEITAIMNNKPGVYYPYKNVQVKFNADGSGEISGTIEKSRIPTYAATFGAPQAAVDLVMNFLPENPAFYLKGKATLVNNQVGIFEPQRLEIGRLPIPLGPILAFNNPLSNKVYAMDLNELISQVSSVSNKEQLIIDFINEKLANINGFYAQDAHMEENKLVYQGTLPETESTVR